MKIYICRINLRHISAICISDSTLRIFPSIFTPLYTEIQNLFSIAHEKLLSTLHLLTDKLQKFDTEAKIRSLFITRLSIFFLTKYGSSIRMSQPLPPYSMQMGTPILCIRLLTSSRTAVNSLQFSAVLQQAKPRKECNTQPEITQGANLVVWQG